ncbi:MAG: cyclase family protein [Chloroflexi bacterium]|nr:cyclase family protein [Chloroflexota bacterium]
MIREEERGNRRPSPQRDPWIDISVPLRDGMEHWPTDPAVRIERTSDIESGDSHTLSSITMGSHTGTHIDAPLHFLRGGAGVDLMPPEATIGRARIIEIRDAESIKISELVGQAIRPGERILFKTRNSTQAWQAGKFVEDFVFLSEEAARFLADRRVRLVGVDYLSVGSYRGGGSRVHQALLGAGVWILEGLNLSSAKPGRYELVCLPLRLMGGDGAPARAIIRPVL